MRAAPSLTAAAAKVRWFALALAAVAAAGTLAGCAAVGPDYRRPSVALDASFIGAGARAVNRQPTPAEIASFWRAFGDARLDALIERALAANGDLRIAGSRLQEARALEDEADAAQRPGLGAEQQRAAGGAAHHAAAGRHACGAHGQHLRCQLHRQLGARPVRPPAPRQRSRGCAGLGQRSRPGAVQTSVAAEVARNYLELRGLQQRLRYTDGSLAHLRDSLRITQARVDNGRGTQLDLARAQGLVAGTEAAVPALQTAIERSIFRLATLTAQPPRLLLAELSTPAPLPSLPFTDLAALPAGTPDQWLQRRPDLIAAERQLAAATAGIGIARAELYPRLSISGLLGLNAASVSNLAKGESAIYSLGAGLSWTPFDLGGVRARIRASEARAQQSLASFEQTVATALEETEGAFSSYTRNAQRADRLDQATRSAEQASRLARLRYEAGVTDFLAVLDAERELLGNRDQLVQAQVGTATALVAVYRALGGGWRPLPLPRSEAP